MSFVAHHLARSGVGPSIRARTLRGSMAAAGLLAVGLAACTTPPADYAMALSRQDPKWHSPQCVEMRAAASSYAAREKQPLNWSTGVLLGPYGLGIAAAGKDYQEKRRKLFVREMHLRCSSRPLPRELQFDPASLGVNPKVI